jgi:hypothetical protein
MTSINYSFMTSEVKVITSISNRTYTSMTSHELLPMTASGLHQLPYHIFSFLD